ncbi:hypothetical protein ABVK25_003913 [Lepraria finkii]|uniref:NmrA-like domain-containing protein n=1 Tax=Lepraria finkii TaxID=1340010 RepID=A0ABR4BF87_9LECA
MPPLLRTAKLITDEQATFPTNTSQTILYKSPTLPLTRHKNLLISSQLRSATFTTQSCIDIRPTIASPRPSSSLVQQVSKAKNLVDTIVASDSKSSFTILALTRNPDSPSAKALAAKSSTIKLVKGNLDDVPACFEAVLEATNGTPIWGVFSVQQALQDGATQERKTKQGKDVVDRAIANGVKIFVQTSVDRGGAKSDSNPTYVPHFISKHNIEACLREKAKDGNMTYTILRPTAFMDGLTPNFKGKMLTTMLKTSLGPKPLSFIATSDIGFFAAQGFLQSESPDYKNQAISLAGDDLTFDEINQIFQYNLG